MKNCITCAFLAIPSSVLLGLLVLFSHSPLVQAQTVANSPEARLDCFGIANGTATDQGCGCGKPADLGCGCGYPGPGPNSVRRAGCQTCGPVCVGAQIAVGCGQCSCPNATQTPPPQAYLDQYTCQFACVSFYGATGGGGVPAPGEPCRMICPTGTIYWPASNSCIPPDAACAEISSQLIQVSILQFHPNAAPPVWAQNMWNFYHVQAPGVAVAFQSVPALAQHSGCLNSFRAACAAGFGGDGLLGHWSNDDIDQCITNYVRGASGITQLILGGEVSAFGGTATQFWTGSGFMLNSCTPAPQWMADLLSQLQCAKREYIVANLTSPVSLIWSDGIDIKKIKSHTKFPLNPKDAGKWFDWRASGITPLVVWDPKRSGQITGPDQLFGDSTWNRTWENGYKALASLDANKNGWLEGSELKSIRLWFDYNQNGVSEKGEVKDLTAVGVISLGVIADGPIEGSKDIFAGNGFKRLQGKTEYTGKSVDWYAGSFDAKLGDEVLTRTTKMSLGLERSDGTPVRQAEVPKPSASAQNTNADKESIKTFSGMWSWHVDDDQLSEELLPGGLIGIRQDGEHVTGRTFSSETYAPNGFGVSERIVVNSLAGDVSIGNDGHKYAKFAVKNSQGQVSENYVRLSVDGSKLEGYSVGAVDPNSNKPIAYRWTGKRANTK